MTAKPYPTTVTGLPIYPKYCHALSPTFGRWCPLTAADVHTLELVPGFEGQDIYHYLNHPIKWVRLTGVIVAAEEISGRMIYTLDDSSGVTIEAVCLAPPKPEPVLLPPHDGTAPLPPPPPPPKATTPTTTSSEQFKSPDGPNLANIDIGSVVKLKGGIGTFRGQKQIRMKSIVLLGDTNGEVKCWKDVRTFKREVLGKEWVVTAVEEERCREEVDTEARLEREEAERRKKIEMKRRIKEKDWELTEKARLRKAEKEKERETRKKLLQKQMLEEAEREERESKEKRRLEREVGKISRGKLRQHFDVGEDAGVDERDEEERLRLKERRRRERDVGRITGRKYRLIYHDLDPGPAINHHPSVT